ncbi:MAG: hypothetical protein AAB609_01035 [Patescibacteria group bacterium]
MERINFFDVSISGQMGKQIPDNTELSVQELADNAKILSQHTFRSENLIQNFNNLNIDPLARNKTQKWEMAVGTVMYAISGQIPDRVDILRGRQIIERLPKTVKSDVDLHFVLAYLPYLLVGFNIDHHSTHVDEANKLENAVAFISKTYNHASVISWSFLCAHRELTVRKPMSLVDEIAKNKILKTVNLQLGILSNAKIEEALVVWKQQQPTEKAGSNMFPDMFINYMNNATMPDLLLLLDSHFSGVQQILDSKETDKIKFSFEGQDEYTNQLEQELVKMFGENWRISSKVNFASKEARELFQLAMNNTSSEISRLKPYFEDSNETKWKSKIKEITQINLERAKTLESKGKTLSTGQSISKVTADAISWFYQNQSMSFEAKSLYETLFYFYWGKVASTNNHVAVGIDRDYSSFQIYSWEKGYKSSDQNGFPILYARRTDEEKSGGRLKEISYRQFWRK